MLLKICGQGSASRTLVLDSGDIWLENYSFEELFHCGKGDLSIGKWLFGKVVELQMNKEVVKLKVNRGECGKYLCQIALENLGGIPEW